MNTKRLLLILIIFVISGCNTTPKTKTFNKVRSLSMDSKTKHYNIGRKESKNEVFKGDIIFDSNDKYISIKNSKWVFPLILKVKNRDKIVWESKLMDGGNDEVSFMIPTNILKSGYKIEVKSFTGVVMDSKVK